MYENTFDYFMDLLMRLAGVNQDPRFHPEGHALFHSLQVFEHAKAECDDPVLNHGLKDHERTELAQFHPRLIGSVATGHVHRQSDIDIQLFCEDNDAPEQFVQTRGWTYEREDVLVRRPGQGMVSYQHLLLDDEYPIELSVYDIRELRKRPKSSTDGKPMVRLTIHDLETMIADDNASIQAKTSDQVEP